MGVRKPTMPSVGPKVGITGRVPQPTVRPARIARVAPPRMPKAPSVRVPRGRF